MATRTSFFHISCCCAGIYRRTCPQSYPDRHGDRLMLSSFADGLAKIWSRHSPSWWNFWRSKPPRFSIRIRDISAICFAHGGRTWVASDRRSDCRDYRRGHDHVARRRRPCGDRARTGLYDIEYARMDRSQSIGPLCRSYCGYRAAATRAKFL